MFSTLDGGTVAAISIVLVIAAIQDNQQWYLVLFSMLEPWQPFVLYLAMAEIQAG